MATAWRTRQTAERRFYSGMALFMIAVVLIGFAPSFYLNGLAHHPRLNPVWTPLLMLYGMTFTLWMLLFWAQTSFIASGRRDLHIQLGGTGMVLAVLLVPLMYATAVGQVARVNQPPFSSPLTWTSVPLFIIPPFAILVWQGWRHRRTAQAHKRLMLGAALIMLDPAIGRFAILPPFLLTFGILSLLSWLTFAPLFWWDMRSLGRLHWATKLGAGLFGLALVLRMIALATPWWAMVAAHLPGV